MNKNTFPVERFADDQMGILTAAELATKIRKEKLNDVEVMMLNDEFPGYNNGTHGLFQVVSASGRLSFNVAYTSFGNGNGVKAEGSEHYSVEPGTRLLYVVHKNQP